MKFHLQLKSCFFSLTFPLISRQAASFHFTECGWYKHKNVKFEIFCWSKLTDLVGKTIYMKCFVLDHIVFIIIILQLKKSDNQKKPAKVKFVYSCPWFDQFSKVINWISKGKKLLINSIRATSDRTWRKYDILQTLLETCLREEADQMLKFHEWPWLWWESGLYVVNISQFEVGGWSVDTSYVRWNVGTSFWECREPNTASET